MLFLFLKYATLLLLTLVYGEAMVRLLHRWIQSSITAFPFALYSIVGLATLSTAANLLSLFLPIGFSVKLGVGIIGLLLLLFRFRQLKDLLRSLQRSFAALTLPAKGAFLFAVLFVLFLTAQPTLSYDEGLYYIQFIKWAETYPVVPGLGNLHHRFGFNSSWHLLSALFNTSSFTSVEENHFNGAIYLLVLVHFLTGWQHPKPFLRFLKAAMLVLLTLPHMAVYNLKAPNADIIIYYLFLFCLDVWITAVIMEEEDRLQQLLVVLICLFIITIKPSALPILLLPALIVLRWLKQKRYKPIVALFPVAFLIVAPWLVRNIILSGYLLFPFEKLDLFSVDWKVPAANSAEARRLVTESAYYLYNDARALQAGSYAQKLKIWFVNNLRIYDKLLLLITVVAPVLFFVLRKALKKEIVLLISCLYAGLLFWFLQAPDPRFGYAYILPIVMLLIAIVGSHYKLSLHQNFFLLCVIALQLATVAIYLRFEKKFVEEGRIKSVSQNTWLLPVPYFSVERKAANGLPVVSQPTTGDQCWDSPLPCTYENMNRVELRGKDLREGFRPVGQIKEYENTDHEAVERK
jgi:hypothetical protein